MDKTNYPDGSPPHAFRVLCDVFRNNIDLKKFPTAETVMGIVRHALEAAEQVEHSAHRCPCARCVDYRKQLASGSICVAISDEESDRLLGQSLRPKLKQIDEALLEAAAWEEINWFRISGWGNFALNAIFLGPWEVRCWLDERRFEFTHAHHATVILAAGAWCHAQRDK